MFTNRPGQPLTGFYGLLNDHSLRYKSLDNPANMAEVLGLQFMLDHDTDVRTYWPCYENMPICPWIILIEASVLGADPARISALTKKWGIKNEDGYKFAKSTNCKLAFNDPLWHASIGDDAPPGKRNPHWNLKDAPPGGYEGTGLSALEAFTDLVRQLGVVAEKAPTHSYLAHNFDPHFRALLQERDNDQ